MSGVEQILIYLQVFRWPQNQPTKRWMYQGNRYFLLPSPLGCTNKTPICFLMFFFLFTNDLNFCLLMETWYIPAVRNCTPPDLYCIPPYRFLVIGNVTTLSEGHIGVVRYLT